MGLHILLAATAAIAIRVKSYGAPPPARIGFIGACPRALELEPAPIEPGWVLSGNPEARVAYHSTADDRFANTAVWDCTAGSFRWHFGWDETVVILEGEVRVVADDGTRRVLRPGDAGYFKAGTWATWHVDHYVKKIAFTRRPLPAPIAVAYRIEAALRAKVGRYLGMTEATGRPLG